MLSEWCSKHVLVTRISVSDAFYVRNINKTNYINTTSKFIIVKLQTQFFTQISEPNMDTTLKAIPENKEPTGPAKPQTIPVVEPKRLNCRNNQTAVQFPNKPSTKASPLKNTSSASPGELEATKRTSWRLSQRSLFTKQPKVT